MIQNQAKAFQIQIINQEKKINELIEENLKLEEEIGRKTNENNTLKSSNQQLNEQLEDYNKTNSELKDKTHELNNELNSCKTFVTKYENIIEDYKW